MSLKSEQAHSQYEKRPGKREEPAGKQSLDAFNARHHECNDPKHRNIEKVFTNPGQAHVRSLFKTQKGPYAQSEKRKPEKNVPAPGLSFPPARVNHQRNSQPRKELQGGRRIDIP